MLHTIIFLPEPYTGDSPVKRCIVALLVVLVWITPAFAQDEEAGGRDSQCSKT